MIERVRLKNFKALRDVTLELGRFTVLVGPNAAGKTTVLEGLHYLCQVARKPKEEIFQADRSPEVLVTDGAEKGLIRAEGSWKNRSWSAEAQLNRSATPASNIVASAKVNGKDLPWTTKHYGADSRLWAENRDDPFCKWLAAAVLLRLDPEQLAAPSYTMEGNRPRVEYDGWGLPSTLTEVATTDPDRFAKLQEDLRRVVPSFRRLRTQHREITRIERENIRVGDELLPRSLPRKIPGRELLFDMATGNGLPASAISEGTLLSLGLLTVLSTPWVHPNLVMLDDIERALHPKAMKELIGVLREWLRMNPEAQIVATSHSPYLLDWLRPDEVWVMVLTDEGDVRADRLDHHPDLEKWLSVMATGEIWSALGEQWLAADDTRLRNESGEGP